MRLRPTKISTRLLLLVLAASMPGFVLLAVDAILRRRAAEENALARASQLVSVITATHESALASTELLLAGLSALPQPGPDEPAACEAFTRKVIAIDSRLANLGAVSPDGDILCSAHPVPPGTTVAGRRWLEEAVRTRSFVVGEHLVGRIVRRPISVVSHPLVRGDSVTAVLFASIDLGASTRLAARSALPAATTLTIIDETGFVLARYPDPTPWVGRRFADEPLVRAMRAGAGTIEERGIDGVPRFYAFEPLAGTGANRAGVAVGIPRAVALAEANGALLRSVVGLLTAALLALGLSNFTAERLILRRTEALVEATDRLRSGDLRARSGLRTGPDDFGRLAGAFDAMADTVEAQTAELQRSRADLRLLARRTEEQVERERRRIARTVHDELGQAVTALKMDTTWISRRVDLSDAAMAERIDEMTRLLDDTSRTIRRIATQLRPSILDDLGLDAAVEWQVLEFSRRTGIRGEVVLRVERNGLDAAVTTALFRILQEALTNVSRHAHASRVVVQLTETADATVLEVRDDGRGLPDENGQREPSLGVLGMKERAQALGGDVVVRNAEPRGTIVRAEIPLPSNGANTP
ncbi:MAG: ATP-binding protein [Longimicrobiales bacterium]